MTTIEIIKTMRIHGHTLNEIASALNQEGHTSINGQPFNKDSVHLYLKRLGLNKQALIEERKHHHAGGND